MNPNPEEGSPRGGSGRTPTPSAAGEGEVDPSPEPTAGSETPNPGSPPEEVPGSPGSDLLPVDELERLFPNLPPDPGEEGKRTLEGIDADGDGVRDDVQRWIYRRYPNEERKRKGMLRYAKALQASIVNVNRDSRDADLTVDAKFSGQVVSAAESSCTDPIR
ncbi:MAG: hypothetical protein Q6L60_02440 [Thermostichus sp. HHBFW_bins_43]